MEEDMKTELVMNGKTGGVFFILEGKKVVNRKIGGIHVCEGMYEENALEGEEKHLGQLVASASHKEDLKMMASPYNLSL